MKKFIKIITNTSLGALLLVLIVGPVGAVARMGGLKPEFDLGSFLGARVNSSGEMLSQIKNGEIIELNVKTFWGQKATYQRAVEVNNKSRSTKTYQLEILEITGKEAEKQTANIYFQKNRKSTIILEPGEKTWVELEVIAPKTTNTASSTTTLKIAVWTL